MLLLLFLPHPQRPFEVFKAKDEEKTCATPNHKGDLLTQTSLVPTKASMFALLKLKAVSNLFQKTYEDKTLKSEIHEQTGIGEIILVLCIDFRKLKILQHRLTLFSFLFSSTKIAEAFLKTKDHQKIMLIIRC